jgi:hypothetical protein
VVLVSRISFSAWQRDGELAGRDVGVDVVARAVSSLPMGAITGMKSRESRSWMISGSMRTDLAHQAHVDLLLLVFLARDLELRAWMKWPSLPVRPTALPPPC